MAALVQQLDTYSKIGIPKLHHHANVEYEDEVEEGEKDENINFDVCFLIRLEWLKSTRI